MNDKKEPVIHMTTDELAIRWNMSPSTLKNYRYQKKGPAYLKFGKNKTDKVLYKMDDVLNYEKKMRL